MVPWGSEATQSVEEGIHARSVGTSEAAVPCRVTSVAWPNEVQARRVWLVFGFERPAGHQTEGPAVI